MDLKLSILEYVCRYKNMDKLIHYVNLDGRVNAFYSTPEAYVAAKHSFNASWPLKTDDFFPYADCPSCMWTGACASPFAHCFKRLICIRTVTFT